MRIFLLLVISIWTVQVKAQLCFNPPLYDSAAYQPLHFINSDLNNDGNVDIIAANSLSSNLSVFLGNGNGTFLHTLDFPVATEPVYLTQADFNGDGFPDIASADHYSDTISILKGDGLGGFTLLNSFKADSTPDLIISADFDNDTKIDIVIASGDKKQISIYKGTENGFFNFQSTISVDSIASAMAYSDFNSDGNMDLAITDYYKGFVNIFFGNGLGGFTLSNKYFIGTGAAISLTISDFNNDGKPDFASIYAAIARVVVYLNSGTGTFNFSSSTYVNVLFDLTSDDFDGDGNMDIAAGDGGTGFVSVLKGLGNGHFSSPVFFYCGNAMQPFKITSADYNNDGKKDIAALDHNSNQVFIFLNCGGIGVTSFVNEQKIIIFPNPATNTLNIELDKNATAQKISIQNVLGENVSEIKQVNNNENSIDVSNLSNGVYFVTILLGDWSSYREKIIISR